LISNVCSGQKSQVTIIGTESSAFSKSLNHKIYETYDLEIKRSMFKTANEKSINNTSITLNLILGENKFQIDLFEDDLLSAALIKEFEIKGIDPPLVYEGFTNRGDEVRLTINNDFIYGFIIENGNTYYIEPATFVSKSASQNQYIFYDGEMAALYEQNNGDSDTNCGSHLLPSKKSIEHNGNQKPQSIEKIACRGLKIAIGSDHVMYNRYGSVQGVANHNIGVMNNVQGDYDGLGNDPFEIEFQIVAHYTATTSSQNPYNSSGSDAAILLPEFATWSANGGFGGNITGGLQGGGSAGTLAQLWTAKSMSYQGQGNVIGLAYTPGNYCVLEDYNGTNANGSAWGLRVLTSHEMGHNFSAGHDSSCGSGNCIMYPSVSGNTSNWTQQSRNSIQNNLNGRSTSGCLASCTNGIQDLGELGVDCGGVCTPCPCGPNETFVSPLHLSITLDNYATETSWNISSSNGSVLYSTSYSSSDNNSNKTVSNLNIDPSNGISLNFFDAYGDGICCSYGSGSYTLRDANNTIIASGGNFAASVSHTFCVAGNNQSTCGDGKQNGDETGIDCGGETCQPCDCTQSDFNNTSEINSDMTIHVQNSITSNTVIKSNLEVVFVAGNSINLNAGFQVNNNAIFEARIENCSN